MRIAVLLVLLGLLLGFNLRASAAAPATVALRPTPGFPVANGTAQLVTQGSRLALTLDLQNLPVATPGQGARATSFYVVWLLDDSRHLHNLGAVVAGRGGHMLSTFTPPPGWTGEATVAISLEARPDPAAPNANGARETIALTGRIVPPVAPHSDGLTDDFGPDWLAPILPAALGLALLRYAARVRRAEQAADRRATPLVAARI
jgi:hypothetical protein